jgi:hypothetical protein
MWSFVAGKSFQARESFNLSTGFIGFWDRPFAEEQQEERLYN